ncbi:polysaccharide biosynthesis C-terminal domain-containing protein [Candidatus Micrarchaeota archaeon]|nr:polysaccharide biosynthesis C-terminal domain-containing protein [Candidatus Micrarchaeota archaeon]
MSVFIYLGFRAAEYVSLSYLISFLLVLPFGLFYVYRIYKGLKPSKEEEGFDQVGFGKEVLAFGVVMMSTLLLNVIVQNIDKVMIGSFLGEDGLDDITVYSFAAAISNLIAIVPVAIATIFLPLASEKISGKKEELKEITDLSTKWIIMGSLPIMIVFAVFSKEILGMIYGSLYESGAFMLTVLAIGIFVRCIAIPAGNTLAALRKIEIEFIVTLVAALVNVGLNFWLIPAYGANGAAFASAVALVLSAGLVVYYYSKVTSMRLEFEWKGLLLAGLLATLVTVGLRPIIEPLLRFTAFTVYDNSEFYILFLNKVVKAGILGIVCALAFGVYTAGLVLSRTFGRHEIEILEGIMERLKLPKKLINAVSNILSRN